MCVCILGGWVWTCPRVCHSIYEGALLSFLVEAGSVLCILQGLRGRSLKFLHSASFASVQHCWARSLPHVAFYRSSGESHSSHRDLCGKRFYPLSPFINCKTKCDLPALMRADELDPTSTWYATPCSAHGRCAPFWVELEDDGWGGRKMGVRGKGTDGEEEGETGWYVK